MKSGKAKKIPLFVEKASHDQFADLLDIDDLTEQLVKNDYDHIYRFREGYNHSFYHVSTFFGEHVEFHAKYLHWYA